VLSVFGRRIKGIMRLRPEQMWTCNVTLHVHICSGRNRIIPLMRRPNTDSTPNKPVTLPRNQLLIRYAVTSPVHTVTIRCYDTQQRYKCLLTLKCFILIIWTLTVTRSRREWLLCDQIYESCEITRQRVVGTRELILARCVNYTFKVRNNKWAETSVVRSRDGTRTLHYVPDERNVC
jgi:hypothetical protein